MLNGWASGGSEAVGEFNSGFVAKGTKKNTGKPNFSPVVSKNMQDPKGEHLWLFSGMG